MAQDFEGGGAAFGGGRREGPFARHFAVDEREDFQGKPFLCFLYVW